MESNKNVINLILKAVALAMGVVTVVLGFLPDSTDISTQITLLGVGLFALALSAMQSEDEQVEAKG